MEHPSPIIDIDDLRQARDRLLHEGVQHYQEASSPVREPILRSWRRSVSEAVPTGRSAFHYLDPRGRSELLRRSASPVLDRLQTDLDGLGVAIFLSDHQGLILSRRAGSAAQRNTLDNACAAEGFDFSEPAVGTNAIGTVLEDKAAHFVQGGEHFNDTLEQLTCAGAPIRLAHTGQVVGSIALTCSTGDSNPLMLSLAVNAARQVEQIMADLDGGRNRALVAALARGSGSTRRIPMAVLTSDAVLSDTAALQFVTPEHYPLLWEAVTSRSWGARPQTIELDLPDGRAVVVAHRISDPTGDAFRLEFQYGTRPHRGRRRDERTPTGSLHAVPAVNERLRYVLQVCTTVAIDGAPGTGKDHVARQIVALDPQRPVRRLDLSTAGRLEDGWFVEAAHVLSTGGDVILRHLEDLDADQVHRVTALARLGSDPADGPGPGSGRLILLVNLESAPEHVKDLVRQTATAVSLPGLADMKEYVPDLAQTILSGMPGITPGTTLSSATRRALTAYPWPGNVRQLRQAMVDVAATRPGWLILPDHLPPWLRGAGQGRRLTGYERAERQAIVAALKEAQGNRSKAAALLGIGRTTLYRKIKSLRIDCPDDTPASPAVAQ